MTSNILTGSFMKQKTYLFVCFEKSWELKLCSSLTALSSDLFVTWNGLTKSSYCFHQQDTVKLHSHHNTALVPSAIWVKCGGSINNTRLHHLSFPPFCLWLKGHRSSTPQLQFSVKRNVFIYLNVFILTIPSLLLLLL